MINEVWIKRAILQALLDEAYQKIRDEVGTYPDELNPLSHIKERAGYRVRISIEKMPDTP